MFLSKADCKHVSLVLFVLHKKSFYSLLIIPIRSLLFCIVLFCFKLINGFSFMKKFMTFFFGDLTTYLHSSRLCYYRWPIDGSCVSLCPIWSTSNSCTNHGQAFVILSGCSSVESFGEYPDLDLLYRWMQSRYASKCANQLDLASLIYIGWSSIGWVLVEILQCSIRLGTSPCRYCLSLQYGIGLYHPPTQSKVWSFQVGCRHSFVSV